MKNNIKIISVILILLGCALIIYPSASHFYYESKQKELMESFLNHLQSVDSVKDDTTEVQKRLINNSSEVVLKPKIEKGKIDALEVSEAYEENILPSAEMENPDPIETLENTMQKKNNMKDWPIEGSLKIDKIDLYLPIIEGASATHLNISIASLNESGKPWLNNNYAIAGHRSRTYGKNFNRLNEIEIGDEICVVDKDNNQYVYEVNGISIVDETDFSVLEDNGISEITLITCDPINVKHPPTRLIVKGILKKMK
ncbi:class D sortase [Fusibacter sp. 3D3]|uniref:class D sortase n=1 Tax=Fusibacter sp. 3D3 TaxID=1048380 RepID=UPI000853C574|nr:class D sortase [Fusibacter sp. 3D3]GAU79826.1 sortase A [Fusibacter sp. 3D3]